MKLKEELEKLEGTLLIIGSLNEEIFSTLDSNKKIKETFYLCNSENSLDDDIEDNVGNVANNINLKELHKYFKNGVDNIYCNYDDIKNHIPAFIRESLRVTKKNIYIYFKYKNDYKKIAKKYKRYKLNCNFYSLDDFNVGVIEANDIIVHLPKETYYYFVDNIEKIYNYISDNI